MSFIWNLLGGFAVPANKTLGFKLNRELSDCADELMAVFGVSSYNHDYENVWEWVEGRSEAGFEVNISRSHNGLNGHAGDWDQPVIIKLTGLTSEQNFKYAQHLASVFQTEIWIGEVIIPKHDDRGYYFEVEEKISPK